MAFLRGVLVVLHFNYRSNHLLIGQSIRRLNGLGLIEKNKMSIAWSGNGENPH